MTDAGDQEPFPALNDESSGPEPSPYASRAQRPGISGSRDRATSSSSTVGDRLRRLSTDFQHSNVPGGFMAATGTLAADLLSLSEQQRAYVRDNDSRNSQAQTSNGKAIANDKPRRPSQLGGPDGAADRRESKTTEAPGEAVEGRSADAIEVENYTRELEETEPFDNGYHFPPSYPAIESTKHGLISFWHYFLTPLGFFVVIYGLNVVAWGGMLFLLLCNASPAMCNGDCNYIDSPRRKWIEYDSQILTALFCVTGFGLIPWRFRDLYYLLQYRVWSNEEGLRRLGGIHRGWYRLPGSQDLPVELGPDNIERQQWSNLPTLSIPYPETRIPDAPRTGVRAPATKPWKIDFVIWTMVWNTFLQAVLSGFMWGMNRYNRPSWSTGLFVALACIVAACGGIMMFVEGKKVKGIEGVPLTERDLRRLERDRELGIPHYNNIKDKKPKSDEEDAEAAKHEHSKTKRLALKVAGKDKGEKAQDPSL